VRLAFCGGFDLDDPEVLAEAAAAAGVPLDDCLRAARDPALDAPALRAARRLLAAKYEEWVPGRRLSSWARNSLPIAVDLERAAVRPRTRSARRGG